MAADTISFARGAPSLDIVDVDGLKDAAARAFANDPGGTTAYGTAIGYPPLRTWIAEQHGVEPANVVVTNGSMQADAFLFDELVEPSDTVVVERPTYDRTLLALRQRLADIRMVELEPDGIDVDALAALIEESGAPKLAHLLPNMVAQAIVHEFCQSGALQRSIDTVRTNLKARVDALVTALERDLPDARFVAPEGGYFMWVELPEGTDVDKLFAAAGERGVTFV